MSVEEERGRRAKVLAVLQGGLARAVLTVGDQAAVSGANFIAQVIVGRGAPEQLGLYALGSTVFLAAMNMQQALIAAPYTVFMKKREASARRSYNGSVLLHQVLLAVLLAFVIFGAAGMMSILGIRIELARVLFWLGAAIAFLLLREFARQLSFAALKPESALMVDIAVVSLQLTVLGVMKYMGLLSAANAFGVMGAAAGLGGLAWLFFRRGDFAPDIASARTDFGENWRYSRWVAAQVIVFVLGVQIYPWFLLHHHGPAENGALAACMGVILLANPFVLGLGNFIAPKAVHALHDEGIAGLHRVVGIFSGFFAAVMGTFALVLIFAGDPIVQLLYGPEYAGNGWVIGILAVSQWIWASGVPLNYGLNALERPDAAFKSLALATVFSLSGGFLLVERYSVIGVALGFLVGNSISVAFNGVTYVRAVNARRAQG